MAILVTGGAGYIGSHTVLALQEQGEDVVVLDNFSNSSRASLVRIGELTGLVAKVYEGDIRCRTRLQEIFRDNDISSVMHFAGLKAVGESGRVPLKYYENNVGGSIILLQEMLAAGVMNFIFSSSATVYGDPERVPLTETCRVGNTTNPYGTSKYMIELILADLVKAEPNFKTTVLRYFNPVGAHPSGLIGEDPSGIPNNLLPFMTQVAIGKLDCLAVYGNDYPTKDGTGVRDYIHVMDLALGHLAALKHQHEGERYKVFNLGTGKGYSVLDLIKAFEAVSGVKIKYKISARRTGDIAQCWSDPGLAKHLLGWQAQYNLEQMMGDAWRWQQNNQNGCQD